jgi:hypothetical protein
MPIKRNLRKNKRTNRKSKHMQRRLSRKQIGGNNDFKFILYSDNYNKGPYGSARNYQVDAFYTLRNSKRDVNFIDYFIPPLDGQPEIKFRLERIANNADVYKLTRPKPNDTVGYLRGSEISAGFANRLFADVY